MIGQSLSTSLWVMIYGLNPSYDERTVVAFDHHQRRENGMTLDEDIILISPEHFIHNLKE